MIPANKALTEAVHQSRRKAVQLLQTHDRQTITRITAIVGLDTACDRLILGDVFC